MKKSLKFLGLSALALLGGFSIIAIANSTNPQATSALDTAIAQANDTPLSLNNALKSSDETVYIITDSTGTANKIFIGSELATSPEPLPITLGITYSLDGSTISANDLTGKSGHVKITYNYTATASYQSKLVPFLVATGLQLDGDKFSNVKLENGKIISENDNYTVVGYSFTGLNENLGTDLLPSSFTLEADVTDFELGNTYTFATNEIIAELDTAKLSSVDDIISSINQLSDGLDQIISGSTQLDTGLDSLVAGVSKLQSGAEALNSGASSLATGATTLATGSVALAGGLATLNTGASELAAGIDSLATHLNEYSTKGNTLAGYINTAITTTIEQLNDTLFGGTEIINPNNYNDILQPIIDDPATPVAVKTSLTDAQASLNLYTNLQNYIAGAAQIAAGANQLNANVPALTTGITELSNGATALATGSEQLSDGADQLLAGTVELKTGVDTLASGSQQLSTGSKALNFGLQTFKSSGIDQRTNFANHDLANFTANLRASVNAARSYHSYGNIEAKSVKFIFKTTPIK